MGYKHLTKEQRYTIMVLLQTQTTISSIAERTGAPVHTQGYRL